MQWLHIIRPHRSTTYVDAAYSYRPSSVVCRSVCRTSEPCKNAVQYPLLSLPSLSQAVHMGIVITVIVPKVVMITVIAIVITIVIEVVEV